MVVCGWLTAAWCFARRDHGGANSRRAAGALGRGMPLMWKLCLASPGLGAEAQTAGGRVAANAPTAAFALARSLHGRGGAPASVGCVPDRLGVCPGTASHASSPGLIWPKDGCASIALPQWRPATFFPCGPPHATGRAGTPGHHPRRQVARGPRIPHSSRDKKAALPPSFAALRA